MGTDIDLLSAVVTVRVVSPAPEPRSAPEAQEAASDRQAVMRPPPSTGYGRAAHALLLDAIRQADPGLAAELHDGGGLKPFTASELIGYSPRRGLDSARSYALRFTAMTKPVTAAVQSAVNGGQLAVGTAIRLTESEFHIEAVDWGEGNSQTPNPINQLPITRHWAAATTYEALSAPWLLGQARPGPRIALEFASPTTFKSNELHVPAPLPGWVFGSLLEKWNAFAPVALPPETRRFAEACLALSSYRLHTRPLAMKDGGVRIGAVGVARYTAINKDRYWLSVMNLLADFALFAGVGAGTTMGMGQCRRLKEA